MNSPDGLISAPSIKRVFSEGYYVGLDRERERDAITMPTSDSLLQQTTQEFPLPSTFCSREQTDNEVRAVEEAPLFGILIFFIL
jgi:hypothetical protein